MKKAIFFLAIVSLVLTGCSSKNSNSTTTTNQTTSSQEISEIDPTLKAKGFIRVELTDPVLYSYLQSTKKGSADLLQSSNITSEEQAKIGMFGKFSKKSKYGLSGLATISSTSTISITSFNYNGSCGTIFIAPTITNNLKSPYPSIKTISSAVSDISFDALLPANLSLIKFDSISVFCSNNAEEPISTANLGR